MRLDHPSLLAQAPRRREAGFTIMEILIAAAILVVGLLGILALFPVAVNTGKRSIEDTNAVLIAQSVESALREGLAQRKGQSKDGKWNLPTKLINDSSRWTMLLRIEKDWRSPTRKESDLTFRMLLILKYQFERQIRMLDRRDDGYPI